MFQAWEIYRTLITFELIKEKQKKEGTDDNVQDHDDGGKEKL